MFWASHSPLGRTRNRQYMSAIFAHGEEQLRLARETASAVAERAGQAVATEIVPFSGFTLAEDYHQKYRLRRFETATREFEAIYPDLEAFVRSTATTRANAFLAGSGSLAAFEAVAGELGLSPDALEELRRVLR